MTTIRFKPDSRRRDPDAFDNRLRFEQVLALRKGEEW